VAPDSRIVYVDKDSLVLTTPAPCSPAPRGRVSVHQRRFARTQHDPASGRQTQDFGQPVALMLNGILGHITDDAEASAIVNRRVTWSHLLTEVYRRPGSAFRGPGRSWFSDDC
jgi:S-adenosyl methyltransferase